MSDHGKSNGIFYESPEKLREIQDEGIRRMMALCEKGHSYYQKRFQEHGIEFSDIQNIDNLETIPLTTKQEYMEHSEEFVLRTPHPSPWVREMIIAHSREIGVERRTISAVEIVERLVYALVNEAAYILAEGITRRASDIDVVYLMG